MKRIRVGMLCVLCLLTLFLMVSAFLENAFAVPALARKYETSCVTCHEMPPRLNTFGEAVLLNGFRWPGKEDEDEETRKEEPIKMGEEAHKKAWPSSVWPSDLPKTTPLSIRSRNYLQNRAGMGGVEAIWEWELFIAGTLGKDVSFWGHTNWETFSRPEANASTRTLLIGNVNLEDLFKLKDILNLQVGIVAVEESDYPHYRSHSTHRLIGTRTFASTQEVPYSKDFAKQNKFRLRRGPGAMLYGFTPRFTYAVGYKIGNQEGGGTDLRDAFFSTTYKIGGVDHYGKNQKFPQGYMENSLSLGLFGALGSADVRPTAKDKMMKDSFWRLGGDARLKLKSWALRGGATLGAHDNPYGTLNPEGVDMFSWFVQTGYYWFPWLLTEVYYEQERIDVPAALKLGDRTRARIVPSIQVLYRSNLRFGLEGSYFTDDREDNKGKSLDNNYVRFTVDFAI